MELSSVKHGPVVLQLATGDRNVMSGILGITPAASSNRDLPSNSTPGFGPPHYR
jgi:hypothetical protein